jgi:CheY-like chemotaxis protein
MQHPAQVLLVDDNPHVVSLLRRWLEHAGYHVTGVTTIPEAITCLIAQTPTRVITDLELPSGSGLDLLVQVRAQQLWGAHLDRVAFVAAYLVRTFLRMPLYRLISDPFRAFQERADVKRETEMADLLRPQEAAASMECGDTMQRSPEPNLYGPKNGLDHGEHHRPQGSIRGRGGFHTRQLSPLNLRRICLKM